MLHTDVRRNQPTGSEVEDFKGVLEYEGQSKITEPYLITF